MCFKNGFYGFLTIYILFSFAQENDLVFVETSAKTGENVEEAFLKCSRTILAKIETGELDPERIGSGMKNDFLKRALCRNDIMFSSQEFNMENPY